ncbi:uncharacterized protein E0L32_006182 [Thyridium curvatum]|uniref:Uncharacterized protein n=1 Tax=Thyridium curvatum TaxID=1093900 RepID=A0A507ATZ5_9PEZI|nr:uncharacterized protein E0L32_006182 [Thyridium curvatum]TPX13452.1 hypothetical protein E0L32_006182 [Thyridium curvatum]
MARSRMSLKHTLLLTTLVILGFFSAAAMAQNDKSSNSASATNSANQPSQSASKSGDNKQSSTDTKASATASSGSASASSSTDSKSTPTSKPPSLTSATSSSGPIRSMPTLSRTVDQTIPTYPPPAVPDTKNAPFMQHSTAPDGTVFIAVGAILGAFGIAILAWRGIVACLLHRSVERAAMVQHAANDKAAFPAPPAPFYKYSDRDSSPHLAARGTRRTTRGPIPSSTPSQTNLFFSPTAAAGGGNGGGAGGSTRDSRFLPSGFYAAGSASPGPQQHTASISLSNLRPDSRGYARAVGPSPPESPNFGPSRATPQPRNVSTSSLNLNRPPSGRAPSAFLDDLLDDQPHMFPPSSTGPVSSSHTRNFSGSTQGRF